MVCDDWLLIPAHPMPVDRKILIVGATSDERLRLAVRDAAAQWPGSRLHLLRPADRTPWPECEPEIHCLAQTPSNEIRPGDIPTYEQFDLAVLAIAHVGRSAYPALVRECLSAAKACRLYSNLGWQKLDARDAESGWPAAIIESGAKRIIRPDHVQGGKWVFFRPSDRTAHHMAIILRQQGEQVVKLETLAELQESIQKDDTVFFDWCITHYNALFRAVQMAMDAGCRMEALLSLDLADLAESQELSNRLIELNRSALPRMARIHYLASRKFILQRYGLGNVKATPCWNNPDRDIWRSEKRKISRSDKRIHIVYHGLFYYWHEITEFLPVLHELLARTPIRFDLFGRVHESLEIDGESLFPEKERNVRKALSEMAKLPGICFNQFACPEKIIQTMRDADFYLGITAGNSLMSQTEIRTGEEEAMAVGMRLIRKITPATKLRGWRPSRDFLNIDVARPAMAAKAILEP